MKLIKHPATIVALLMFFSPVYATSVYNGRQQAPRDSVQTASDSSYNYGMSLRTNLLWWGAAEPNLSVDIPLGEHVTVGVSGGVKT